MTEKLHRISFFLTAAEVNAQREMPLSRIVTTIIDVATSHANALGIGFDRMIREGISWVLSRLTVDIVECPSVNRNYRMETWVESATRLFSERDFELIDIETGKTVLRAHSVWMAINMATRRPGDLSPIWEGKDIVNGRNFEGDKGGKLLPLQSADKMETYRFATSDIDVNRHVTTRRYIDLMTDLWPLDFYDTHRLTRFEVAFKHEARYGEDARVMCAHHGDDANINDIEIKVGANPCCLARLHFTQRQ